MSPTMASEWIKRLDHSDFCLQSWRKSPEAVAVWVRDLDHGDAGVRAAAARMLGSMGPTAQPAVEALTKLLRDDEPSVRSAARHALQQITPAQVSQQHKTCGWWAWAVPAGVLLVLSLALAAWLLG
jgi:HEAT repeat protein